MGLSAKKKKSDVERPLSSTTNSGSVIARIEEKTNGVSAYKTNLVKCLPLDEESRLRYPSINEINACIGNFDLEIAKFSPQIVFLLGSKVANAIGQHYKISFDAWVEYNFNPKCYKDIYFVPIHHPSYVHIYKRETMDDYVEAISQIIKSIRVLCLRKEWL